MRAIVLLALVACAAAKPKKALLSDRSGFHAEGGQDCARKERTVRLKTSSGPRRVRYEETKEPGYLDEPQLKQIFYINTESDKGNMEKMEVKHSQSLASTKVGAQLKQKNLPEVTYTRFKGLTEKDIKKKESKELFRLYSNGELGEDAKQKEKVQAIWLTQVKLLEQIAKKQTNNASDHQDVYFIMEDDVAFVHDNRARELKTD